MARLGDMAHGLREQQARLAKQATAAKQAQTWQAEYDALSQTLLLDDYACAHADAQAAQADYAKQVQQWQAQADIVAQLTATAHTACRRFTSRSSCRAAHPTAAATRLCRKTCRAKCRDAA
ncbi:chromosome segregation protein SMC [Moraxella atlantae]|uniref:Chromosome segregation protein SMC n=1 Tax=Faucicola atlantae TaxID=34059 RepID=A0A378QL46_9GAMM|nr:chromosome segregation protein SMC [Moraxella atlantae]